MASALIMLALSKSEKGYNCLLDGSEIISIIEEYANGGFEIIQSKLIEDENYFDNPDSFIDELLSRS